MKVVISTTHKWNVGDSIIREGVKKLLKAKYGDDIEYISWNRNPDNQDGKGDERHQRPGLIGNYFSSPELIKYVDLVVLAGSPEFRGPPLRGLFQAAKDHNPNIPLLALGVGLGYKDGTLDSLDQWIFSRSETKIITRSIETTEMLARYGIKSKALPCPALFAFDPDIKPEGFFDSYWAQDGYAKPPETRGKTLLILQAPGTGWHEVPDRILDGVPTNEKPEFNECHHILTVHVKEFEYYSRLGYNPRYAASPPEFARIVSQYDRVVSTRLHGAIGALSLGIPTIVVAQDDFRIKTAAKMFGAYLPLAATVREALATKNKFAHDLEYYKTVTFEAYKELLK